MLMQEYKNTKHTKLLGLHTTSPNSKLNVTDIHMNKLYIMYKLLQVL